MSIEAEIKAVVLNKLIGNGRIDSSSLIFSEMNLAGKVRRVDVGYINNKEMVAVEVKSEKDSLVRLAGQVLEYRKYFDRVILAVAPKFVVGAIAMVADDVAIWEVSNGGVRVVRKGRLIRSVKKESYIELMTKREVAMLARKVGLHPGDMAIYELKMEVLSRVHRLSKFDVKEVLLDGIYKRFGLASRRFLLRAREAGVVNGSDVRLLSPYLKVVKVD